jgi:hypothetical protein
MSALVGVYFDIVIPVHRYEQGEGKLLVKCLSNLTKE